MKKRSKLSVIWLCLILILFIVGFCVKNQVRANDVARQDILRVEEVWDKLEIFGAGQTVAVADTGLDTGDLETLSADFAGRVVQTFALGRPDDWSDPNGHGTHVAGSVLGNGSQSGSEPGDHRYTNAFTGVAPEANLVFQSLLDDEQGLGGLPDDDLADLFQQAYDAGARIHTNSWGANFFISPLARFLTAGAYTVESAQTDRFVWEHQDMVILFAAGNEGTDVFTVDEDGNELIPLPDGIVDGDSIGSPGTAKNVITVGASESLRSEGGDSELAYGEGGIEGALLGFTPVMSPLAEDKPSNDANGMAVFSSRGPTNDGRIKPDVVAPGTNIISVYSHHPDAMELYGLYDKNYAYCSGTSMATPLVAGAVTLIRAWYVDVRDVDNPSAALIKATLINGAVDISPGQYGRGDQQEIPDAWPNAVTGWGRVDLAASIAPDGGRELWFDDSSVITTTGDVLTFTRYADGDDAAMRVTLVWTDPPGEAEPEGVDISVLTGERAAAVLVNDLDLEVEAPDGRVFLGNGERDDSEEADRLNNVEAIRIPNPPAGDYQITVRGHKIAEEAQPFALVLSGKRVVSGPKPTPTPLPTPTVMATAVGEDGDDTDAIAILELFDFGKEEDETDIPWLLYFLIGAGVIVLALLGVLLYVLLRHSKKRHPSGATYQTPTPSAPEASITTQPVAAAMMIQNGPHAGTRIQLKKVTVTIGRSSENDIVLADERVSRHHARIERRGTAYILIDQNSANGTYVNGIRITEQRLVNGDEVFMGSTSILFAMKL